MNNPLKTLDQLIYDINHDTYFLTRDDIDAIDWRLREILNFIKETYEKRGKVLL